MLATFSAGLAFAAWKNEGGMRTFLLCCLVLNLWAAARMIADDHPFLYVLMPNDRTVWEDEW